MDRKGQGCPWHFLGPPGDGRDARMQRAPAPGRACRRGPRGTPSTLRHCPPHLHNGPRGHLFGPLFPPVVRAPTGSARATAGISEESTAAVDPGLALKLETHAAEASAIRRFRRRRAKNCSRNSPKGSARAHSGENGRRRAPNCRCALETDRSAFCAFWRWRV